MEEKERTVQRRKETKKEIEKVEIKGRKQKKKSQVYRKGK